MTQNRSKCGILMGWERDKGLKKHEDEYSQNTIYTYIWKHKNKHKSKR